MFCVLTYRAISFGSDLEVQFVRQCQRFVLGAHEESAETLGPGGLLHNVGAFQWRTGRWPVGGCTSPVSTVRVWRIRTLSRGWDDGGLGVREDRASHAQRHVLNKERGSVARGTLCPKSIAKWLINIPNSQASTSMHQLSMTSTAHHTKGPCGA